MRKIEFKETVPRFLSFFPEYILIAKLKTLAKSRKENENSRSEKMGLVFD